jgi:hypothetical protein
MVYYCQINIDKDTYKVRVPENNTFIKLLKNDSAHFVVVIDNFEIHRFRGRPGTMMPGPNGVMMMTGGESEALIFEADYYFWDNYKKQLVSYGSALEHLSFLFAMTDETWKKAIKGFAKGIFNGTPFYHKRTKTRR